MRIMIILIYTVLLSQKALAVDCYSMVLQSPKIKTSIKQFTSEYYNTNSINFRSILGTSRWYIAEIESKDFEPVIVILKKKGDDYLVKAEWGGSTEGADPKKIIVKYFKEKVPSIPDILLTCFMPKGPPFIVGSIPPTK